MSILHLQRALRLYAAEHPTIAAVALTIVGVYAAAQVWGLGYLLGKTLALQ
jgi:hypothetical protein